MPSIDGKFYHTKEWIIIRRKCLIRDNFCCVWCGASVVGKGQSRVDHIKTAKDHPELRFVLANLRTLCVTCDANRHRDKAPRTVERKPCDVDGYPEAWR